MPTVSCIVHVEHVSAAARTFPRAADCVAGRYASVISIKITRPQPWVTSDSIVCEIIRCVDVNKKINIHFSLNWLFFSLVLN